MPAFGPGMHLVLKYYSDDLHSPTLFQPWWVSLVGMALELKHIKETNLSYQRFNSQL